MDYSHLVMQAIDYIEVHLREDISQEDVAAHVGFSVYHFHRIFQVAVKDSITGYIRERRLTQAAHDLLQSPANIVDIAFDYHFKSHEAFSRAFRRMFGVTPRDFRGNRLSYQTLFRVSQRQKLDDATVRHLMGGVTSEPSFVDLDAMTLVGLSRHSSEGAQFGALWHDFVRRRDEIPGVCDPQVTYGLIAWTETNGEFEYVACAQAAPAAGVPEGMVQKRVAANRYAVFTHTGPTNSLEASWYYALGIWLPRSGYKRADAHAFERYDTARFLDVPEHQAEIDLYIPVADKGASAS